MGYFEGGINQAELSLELEGIFREKGKENLSATGGDKKSDTYKSGLPILANLVAKPFNTREELANIANISGRTLVSGGIKMIPPEENSPPTYSELGIEV